MTADASAHVRRWPGRMPVRHRYTPGIAGERFLTALRDRGVILGSRCAACRFTYVPARLFCPRCFDELTADVEAGPGGTLVSTTLVHVDADGRRLARPVALGLVRLDGADTTIVHFLLDAGELPAVGGRVEAVLRPPEERGAAILDIAGFRAAARG